MQSRKNIVIDDEHNITLRREKIFKYSYCQQQFAVKGGNLQRAKEKQLLQQWKMARDLEKKARSNSRKYAITEKQMRQMEEEEEEEEDEEDKDAIQWAHKGCNAVCKADKCIWWLLESGLC
jgi:hypothetical protein